MGGGDALVALGWDEQWSDSLRALGLPRSAPQGRIVRVDSRR